MIEESGEVIAVAPPYATVVTQRRSSCSSCATKGCGTATLNQLFAARSHEMQVLNPIDARVGERVVLGVEEGTLLRSSLAVYIVPLITLIVGALLGEKLVSPLALPLSADAAAVVGALLGGMAGFLWVQRFTRRIAQQQRYMAVVLRRDSQAQPLVWHHH